MSLDQYSQTPASNDLVNYGQTGMAPSKVKNAFWDVMADMCSVVGTGSMPTTGGTANAQTIVNTRQYAALYAGMWAAFIPSATNTGALTLQVDGLAAKNVFANGVAAIAGMVVLGVPAICRYDGTQWNLINPQRSTGSFTGTPTGFSGSPGTCTVAYSVGPDGHSAQLQIGTGMSGTSNATTFTITGMPSFLAPVNTQAFVVFSTDSGAPGLGSLVLTAASQIISLGKANTYAALTGWTASGTKVFPVGNSCAISYQI